VGDVQLWREVVTVAVAVISGVLLVVLRQISQGGSTGPGQTARFDSPCAERDREAGRLLRLLRNCRRALEQSRSARGRRGKTR